MKIEIVQRFINGVADTPKVFTNYQQALAYFRSTWEELIGEDAKVYPLLCEDDIDYLNNTYRSVGLEVLWWCTVVEKTFIK